MSERDKTHTPARVIVGHCPDCRGVLVVENNYEVWPLVYCCCGWVGATDKVENRARYERGESMCSFDLCPDCGVQTATTFDEDGEPVSCDDCATAREEDLAARRGEDRKEMQ